MRPGNRPGNQGYLKDKSSTPQSPANPVVAKPLQIGPAGINPGPAICGLYQFKARPEWRRKMRFYPDSAVGKAGMDPLASCERALELALTNRGKPAAEVDRVLEEFPRHVFAHCLRAALIVRADDVAARFALAVSVTVIETTCPEHDSARRHAAAARAWLDGDQRLAGEHYSAILSDNPRDIVALMVANALDFRLGQRRMLRDRVARVMPYWGPSVAGFASVLAMYAFGLEENGQYRRAETAARRALALDPGHPGAIHVIAHVMEMQGRAQEGLAFLAANEPAWKQAAGIAVHLAWHRALFHLDSDDPESALAVYDAQVANTQLPDLAALADASALLWRLQLRNVAVGARWRQLADRWQAQNLTGARPFFAVHAIMALAAAGRPAAAARVFDALPPGDTNAVSASYPEDALTPPLCKALLAFARGEYAACVEWLKRVRNITDRCGGSLAQCDLIHLTFTEAALRARKAGLARALVAERTAQKPASRLNRLLQRRLG
jgi:tetratricopeptide (TPR) repeat protein